MLELHEVDEILVSLLLRGPVRAHLAYVLPKGMRGLDGRLGSPRGELASWATPGPALLPRRGPYPDAVVSEGAEVLIHYDPLMAKLIVWGHDRGEAIRRMTRALAEFGVSGVRTTIPFHRAVMRHPDFVAGRLSTAFVERLEPDAPLVVLEAMKMENEFRATAGGVVSEVAVPPGQAVNAGDLLVVISPEGT